MIRYRGTSPKLGGSQGECPYPILNSLLVKKKVVVMAIVPSTFHIVVEERNFLL